MDQKNGQKMTKKWSKNGQKMAKNGPNFPFNNEIKNSVCEEKL